MPLTRHRPLALALLLAAICLAGCDAADVDVSASGEASAGGPPPGSVATRPGAGGPGPAPSLGASVSGLWFGVEDVRNPGEARLAGCTIDLRALEGSLAATIGPDCATAEPLRVVQSGSTFTIARRVVACGDGSLRAESGGGTLDRGTIQGRLDLTGEAEVRTRFFNGTVDGDRVALGIDRLRVEDAIVQGECLVGPPLRVEVTVVP
jgi:hypothetical protein